MCYEFYFWKEALRFSAWYDMFSDLYHSDCWITYQHAVLVSLGTWEAVTNRTFVVNFLWTFSMTINTFSLCLACEILELFVIPIWLSLSWLIHLPKWAPSRLIDLSLMKLYQVELKSWNYPTLFSFTHIPHPIHHPTLLFLSSNVSTAHYLWLQPI